MLPCPNDSDVSSVRSPVDTCNLVYSYSRSQAIADGMLVDLTEWASATTGFLGGFRIPVAVTAGVWSDLNSIPPRAQGYQDVRGRAHDLLYMASLAARHHPNENSLVFLVLIDIGRTRRQQYRLLVGPGDQGEPVATILRLNED